MPEASPLQKNFHADEEEKKKEKQDPVPLRGGAWCPRWLAGTSTLLVFFVQPVTGDFATLTTARGGIVQFNGPSFCHIGPGCRWPPVYGCLSGL